MRVSLLGTAEALFRGGGVHSPFKKTQRAMETPADANGGGSINALTASQNVGGSAADCSHVCLAAANAHTLTPVKRQQGATAMPS